eukprot:1801963-Prymnesium_polylepis.1
MRHHSQSKRAVSSWAAGPEQLQVVATERRSDQTQSRAFMLRQSVTRPPGCTRQRATTRRKTLGRAAGPSQPPCLTAALQSQYSDPGA